MPDYDDQLAQAPEPYNNPMPGRQDIYTPNYPVSPMYPGYTPDYRSGYNPGYNPTVPNYPMDPMTAPAFPPATNNPLYPATPYQPGRMQQPGITPSPIMQPPSRIAPPPSPLVPPSPGTFREGPPTLTDIGYTPAFLKTMIGSRVSVTFLLGTGTMQDRNGTLLQVGINYILLQEAETDDLLLCDMYSIKFVRFYR